VPAGVAQTAPLEEQAVGRAGERHGLGHVETAAVDGVPGVDRPARVVPAVGAHLHPLIVPDRTGSVWAVTAPPDLLRWSEALAGIARTGLAFTESLYERERFQEVLHVAADIRAAAEGGVEAAPLVQEWMRQVGAGVAGYVTPKVAVGAVVGNDAGELLLVQRADNGVWLYPTGWADIGYSASEEETGMEIEPLRLIAVLDGLRLGFTAVPLYSLVFHCRVVGGELRRHPLECLDVGWFAEDALPEPLAGAARWSVPAFQAIRGEIVDVVFDRPRHPPWRRHDELPSR
jgi:ADP-ribose pyrophosphatase YjhB (NUDIX family)